MALGALSFAIADTCPDRAALRKAFDVYAAGPDRMNGLPVGDRFLELLRESLADMRAVIEQQGDHYPATVSGLILRDAAGVERVAARGVARAARCDEHHTKTGGNTAMKRWLSVLVIMGVLATGGAFMFVHKDRSPEISAPTADGRSWPVSDRRAIGKVRLNVLPIIDWCG